MLFGSARRQHITRTAPRRRSWISASLLATFHLGQPSLVNLGDTGEGADVLTVLLDVARESQLHRGDQLHGLRQCLMPFGEFLQPLVDGHGFSVARRQLATARHWGTRA